MGIMPHEALPAWYGWTEGGLGTIPREGCIMKGWPYVCANMCICVTCTCQNPHVHVKHTKTAQKGPKLIKIGSKGVQNVSIIGSKMV